MIKIQIRTKRLTIFRHSFYPAKSISQYPLYTWDARDRRLHNRRQPVTEPYDRLIIV